MSCYRIEVRLNGSWEQPIVVTHPSERFAVDVAEACAHKFGVPCRVTVGDNPDPRRWGEGTVVYEASP